MELVLEGEPVQDDLLAKELEQHEIPPDTAENFFRICITGKFPKSAEYLIAQDKSNGYLAKTLSTFYKTIDKVLESKLV